MPKKKHPPFLIESTEPPQPVQYGILLHKQGGLWVGEAVRVEDGVTKVVYSCPPTLRISAQNQALMVFEDMLEENNQWT